MRQRDREALDRLLEARRTLKETWELTPDTTLYLAQRHRTRSGYCDLSVIVLSQRGENVPLLWDLAPQVGRALSWTYIAGNRGVRVPVLGMSPAATLAKDLYTALFGFVQNRRGAQMFYYHEM